MASHDGKPALPVQVSALSGLSLPEGFVSPSMVAVAGRDGRVVVMNRASWKAASMAVAPIAFMTPQLLRGLLGWQHGNGWFPFASLTVLGLVLFAAAFAGRTGGLVRLWFEPRRWGRRGILFNRAFSPETAATAQATISGQRHVVAVHTTDGRQVRLCTVPDAATASELVRMLRQYAALAAPP